MNIEAQRHRLQRRMENDCLSLRNVGELTGISFSTLSRFNRGSEMTYQNLRKLKAWLDSEPIPRQEPLCTRRFKVGPLTFLVTVELINDKEKERDESVHR